MISKLISPLDGGPEHSQMIILDIIWWKMQLELPVTDCYSGFGKW